MSTKGYLTAEKVASFKERLKQLKKETEKQLALTNRQSPSDSIQELADYPSHPADMGTEQFEQQRDAGFDLMKKDYLQDINDALERIEKGTYGFSEKSGKPIPEARLEAEPTARNLAEEE